MTDSPRPLVPEIARAMAAEFVRTMADRFHLQADFSPSSLDGIEGALPAGADGESNDSPERFSVMLGYYLGEVVRRKWGGHWVRKDDVPVLVGVGKRVQAVFPVTKAIRRLREGPRESLVEWYTTIARECRDGPDA